MGKSAKLDYIGEEGALLPPSPSPPLKETLVCVMLLLVCESVRS